MAADKAAILAALDAALHDRVKLEFEQLFNNMFTGRKDVAAAVKTFRIGMTDHIEAHRQASAAIDDIIKGSP